MKINLKDLENEVKEISREILNEVGAAAIEAATSYVTNTYNTKVDKNSIKTTLTTKNNLVFKIVVKGGPISLVKKVVRLSSQGATVLVKRGSPKFIRSAFVAPWQKGQSRRWLFLRRGRKRRSLYTIGLAAMYRSRGTMRAIAASINKTLRKFK